MTNNIIVNEEAEKVYNLLRNPAEPYHRPLVTETYLKDGKFDNRMRNTYGTKEIADLVTDLNSNYYADYRLPWAYFGAKRYDIEDYWAVYHLCDWIDPSFGVPQDYRLGMNDRVYRVDMSIKDASMRNSELYKPSIEHIVPKAKKGPVSDIRNIMILPLTINKMLGDVDPITRDVFLKGCQSKSFQNRVQYAESLFG